MTEPDEFNPSGWGKVLALDDVLLIETSDSGELRLDNPTCMVHHA